MPVMRWRVVCALREVIDTFCPAGAFISVDLPTFGRPTMAISPQRCSDAGTACAPSPERAVDNWASIWSSEGLGSSVGLFGMAGSVRGFGAAHKAETAVRLQIRRGGGEASSCPPGGRDRGGLAGLRTATGPGALFLGAAT